ncbi:VIT domain-containing protein [Steroidobacter flavus]|uniref:VIT domain-containing protein n=1 Tax=Steroidobacter flavus TaxID=1842136 RepID=A0ABV8SUF3_9GAMM
MLKFRFQPVLLLMFIGVAQGAAKVAPELPNPSLAARERGIDDQERRRFLPIGELQVDVRVVGAVARTTVRIHFENPSRDELEGDLSLALPEQATVIGYALNVEKNLVDGVLAEPSRARASYEERVRRTVDPGLAEVSRSNVFSTRVYPIVEDGRTIRMTFVAPVHATKGWTLPLVTDHRVRRVTFTVRAEGVTAAPQLRLPSQLQAQWTQQGDAFLLSASLKNTQLSGELHLGPSTLAQPLLTSTHPNGRRFFQLNDTVAVASAARASSQRLRLYWDRSLSRKDDDLDAEIGLVTRYIQASRASAIEVVLFNSSGATVESFPSAEAVETRLRRVVYRGATSFAMLQAAKVPEADTCLLFSDGIATIDTRQTFAPKCNLFAVTSASDADIGYLAHVMKRSADAVLRLDRNSTDEVLTRLSYETPAVVDVRDSSGAALLFASLPAPRGQLAVVGEAPAAGDIFVRIAGSGSEVVERRYQVGPAPVRFDGAGALWAADRVTQLAALERRKELRSVSRRFNVASPHMAFIVLEGPADYIQARIAPPNTFPKEWRAEYEEMKKAADESRRERREQHLAHVINQWEDQKSWWAKDFDPTARSSEGGSRRESVFSPSAPGDLAEIAVTGMRRSSSAENGAVIELAPWKPSRPYLKALDAAKKGQLERVLAAEEKKHGSLPVFYLDVAEWFQRQGKTASATEMLLSALELPTKDDETLMVVASRLVRYGQFDRGIWLYERIIELIPDRPQPLRALALALAERAKHATPKAAARDLQRAVSLLNTVISSDWDEAYAGIDLISLMEVNTLIPRLQKLGVQSTALDPRLIAPLDVDVRVVIEWNTPATDIDLWVTEPNGERSMYNNPLTAIGGRLSNDMTSGFGPEEYLLRRAPDGRFAVDANVYAADRINPNGATIVTARLTHNFGRPDEHTEMLDIELRPEADGEVPLGAFVLTKQSGGFAAQAAPVESEDEDEDEDQE